jgi:hypothetical protein
MKMVKERRRDPTWASRRLGRWYRWLGGTDEAAAQEMQCERGAHDFELRTGGRGLGKINYGMEMGYFGRVLLCQHPYIVSNIVLNLRPYARTRVRVRYASLLAIRNSELAAHSAQWPSLQAVSVVPMIIV